MSSEEALAEEAEASQANRHWEFWWYPTRDFAEVKTLALTDEDPESVAGKRFERIDWSCRILPTVRELRFTEMEYSLPADVRPPVLQGGAKSACANDTPRWSGPSSTASSPPTKPGCRPPASATPSRSHCTRT